MKFCKSFTRPEPTNLPVARGVATKVWFTILGAALLLVFLSSSFVLGQTINESLFDASRAGDAQKVKAILDQKADINTRSPAGRTPLMIAAMNGQAEVVKILLDRGADAQLQDSKGQTAKQLATEFGQAEVVKLLDQAAVATDPQLAFFTAVGKGDIQAAQSALEHGADVNAPTGPGVTAVMAAASRGMLDNHAMLKFLLEKGATVNATDHEGRTPFDYADLPGCPTDEEGQRLLQGKGAITEKYAARQLNELLRDAVRTGDGDKAGAALAKKADPNYVGKDGPPETVLMIAAEAGNLDIVKRLLKSGANPNRTMIGNDYWQGKTALLLAAGAGQSAVVKALIENGAKVNVQQVSSGYTPLVLASMGGDFDTVKLLIENGADPNAKDSKGRTALAVADGPRRSEIQQLLIKAGAVGQAALVNQKTETTKTNATNASPKAAPPIDAKKLTKAEWKKAYFSRFPAGSIVTVAKFKVAFGGPARTQTVENDAYWYYECSDGTIQVVLNDPNVFGSGACVQSVNDY